MLQRLLVPLDGSPLAESILPVVHGLVRLTGANVTLLQAVPTIITGETVEPPSAATLAEARHYLGGVAQQLTLDLVTTHSLVVEGEAAEAIVAAGRQADLIVMATHGRAGLGRLVFGSVASAVLGAATVPVLLVRAGSLHLDGHRFHHLLVPLDGSPLAEQALPLAVTLARLAGARLTLCSVVPSTLAGPDQSAGLLSASRAYLTQLRQRLGADDLSIQITARVDEPVSGILACAGDQPTDLIVMSSHGRSGLGRLVRGSVAEAVLHQALSPLLIIRADVPYHQATTA